MTDAVRRRAGRPSEPVLSRELITRTALRLLSEHGEESWGMRHIARELGVRPSALYNHVANQEDLLGAVRELVSDRIDVSGFGVLAWDAALDLWACSYREVFAAHPRTITLLALQPLRGAERTVRSYDAVCAGLESAGWPVGRVLSVVVALENLCLGAAFDRAAPADMMDPGAAGESPLGRAYRARSTALGGASPADAAFELGLNAMLEGLRAEFAALTAS